METRKIQLTGGSTFTVSLPKRWAKEHGLESGAQMHLYPHSDGSLLVRPDPTNNGEREIALTVDHRSDEDIVQTVRAGYVSGFDRITLVATGGIDDSQRTAVTRTVDGLVGLEIVSESRRRVVLQSLLDTSDVSIRQTVIQLQRITLSMHENAVTAAINGDSELAARVCNRDDEADRLFGMVSRHYQQSLSDLQAIDQLDIDRPSIADYYTTAQQLERVADHAEKMAVIADRLDVSAADTIPNFDSIARSARGIVTDASSVLLAGADVEMAYRALDDRDTLLAELDRSDKRLYDSDSSDQHPAGLLLDSVRRTSEYGGNIAETMIQRAVRTGSLSE
ncbi:phosphate uptake regulator PhoU [Halocatena salina]|uniref:Phosphate uptake regulator PhoU n=1 Tax=Halocatena salina TaxID=2934340 RepID=A0A8U0A329_9EURY|nr:phosphate uptake regulator PhoU [Halocatena salina]UPM43444.1 phosphate uptake regulator PhoU [Halocatena salina]